MDTYPENAPYEDLALYSQLAAEAAQAYLDTEGNIDYTLFDNDTLGAMASGPSFVREPAEVEPCHIGTSTAEFAGRTNNFHLLFSEYWGEDRRMSPFYQRFAILFPDLAQTLYTQYQEYSFRCMTAERPAYRPEPEMFEPLRIAYGIMSQLIDRNDVYYGDQYVRDIDATRVLRA